MPSVRRISRKIAAKLCPLSTVGGAARSRRFRGNTRIRWRVQRDQPGPQVREVVPGNWSRSTSLIPHSAGIDCWSAQRIHHPPPTSPELPFSPNLAISPTGFAIARGNQLAYRRGEWDWTTDFQSNRTNANTVLVNYHIGQVTMGGGDAFLQIPTQTATSTAAQPAVFINSGPL